VVVAGGHSAGHIEPTMNLVDALRRLVPTAEITALGTVRGLDTTLVSARGYPLELIPPAPSESRRKQRSPDSTGPRCATR
jgi:UDP-N-acetylglucosamine--N-acetylmuramyl-(pentapeptide) pyrophosphoryl-undecaprenol N-acetylglucosamine transferase